MSDIELVIKIPEEDYTLLKSVKDTSTLLLAESRAILAIRKGTPLPEHHGRLLILDEQIVERNLVSLNATTSFCNKWLSEVGISNSVVKIIPATKEGDGE